MEILNCLLLHELILWTLLLLLSVDEFKIAKILHFKLIPHVLLLLLCCFPVIAGQPDLLASEHAVLQFAFRLIDVPLFPLVTQI